MDASVAENAAAALRHEGLSVTAASGPIDTRDGCHRLVRDTLSKFGRLDILIHNAGWVAYQSIEELDEDFLGRMMALGAEAPLWLAQRHGPR